MVAIMNEEQPVPPGYHEAPRRCGRLTSFGTCAIVFAFAVTGVIYFSSKPDPLAEHIERLDTRINALERSHGEWQAYHEKIIADTVGKIKDASTRTTDEMNSRVVDIAYLTAKKRLIDVPLTLMVSADVAHDLMMSGNIMRDEYRAFAATMHNMAIDEMVQQYFIKYSPWRAFVFNLHHINRESMVRFTKIITRSNRSPDIAAFEGINTTCVCNYQLTDPIGSWMGYKYPDNYDDLLDISIINPTMERIAQTC